MPLIIGNVTDTVVYVYPTYAAALGDLTVGATGFLAYVPATPPPSDIERLTAAPKMLLEALGHLYVVTNRHVVIDVETGMQREAPAIVVRRRDEQRVPIVIAAKDWHTHPDGDDVAVASVPLSSATYIAAAFPTYAFITRSDIEAFGVGPGLDVYYTGRFQTAKDRPSITALRFGSISAMPMPVPHPGFDLDVESLLIEGRARVGYSGSPVVPALQRRPMDRADFLLGIHWGQMREWQEAEITIGTARVHLPEGIMAVAPAWRILEIIDSDHLRGLREI
jgi:hypothetical protein